MRPPGGGGGIAADVSVDGRQRHDVRNAGEWKDDCSRMLSSASHLFCIFYEVPPLVRLVWVMDLGSGTWGQG